MKTISQCRPILGTYVEISLSGKYSEDELLEISGHAFREIQQVHEKMGFHDLESELSEINRTAYNAPIVVSPEMQMVLSLALKLSALTNGAYDVSIGKALIENNLLPDHSFHSDKQASWQDIELTGHLLRFNKPLLIDLGGIAKGFAVDQAFKVIPKDLQCTINAGGDIRMSHWQEQEVAIRVPGTAGAEVIELPMQDSSIATSSSHFVEAASAIVDTKTNSLIDDRRSISIFASSCMVADALTKVVFLYKDFENILEHFQAKCLIVDEAGNGELIG